MSLAPAADIQKQSSAPSLSEKTSTSGSTPTLNEKGTDTDTKGKKRSLFGFGKKKTEDKPSTASAGTHLASKAESSLPSPPHTQDTSQLSSRRSTQTSPGPMDASQRMPSSPGRGRYSSTSPRLASPAGSQIFERDVQESAAVMPNSPAIPSHIQVENHIPPALDATSEAITNDHLSPDSVEIVTHASHQPASVTVTGASTYETQSSASWVDELQSLAEKEEAASNYGSLDSADVRRLSFISFADVVQAEQGAHGVAASSRDSMQLAGLTSLSSSGINRSPSPVRSPISSQGPETSPPTSKSGSIKGLDMSPSRKPLGSPISAQHTLGAGSGSELNIETMSQALRRTGSTDLSAARSLPISPIEGPQ
ncbi:hypothetical protein JX265_000520 [Neoarthrinium moseri]|uniref:Uncharacterized protein n=1 Tax=Neoarthrinium moseri TaxID=1658444 RepID=A0A9P9WYK6_9PEZI|nr:uncharacterized protein JN550_001729 [Neoarthrinium moseri]KAI1876233.1 hypothetical protein JN550_001729 [Neoarthrinium moseri]KAI1881694.1 hypothetical protein JX265_000520 [Neoarthrinium moseri]